jgi:hypothetical protein
MNGSSESTDEQFDNEEDLDVTPDASITAELFLEWRAPRRGRSNPEQMNNPVWEWLIRSKWSAYRANHYFKGISACQFGPGWCFNRFGQSSTPLPDGRIVQIAGEHEDHYDPDFFIYNDVVIRHPDGTTDIFGYPTDIFPPTDFHSATLARNRIIIIGNLGYPDQRQPGTTPVFILDVDTFRITPASTSGTPPGWLHGHRASFAPDGQSILIQGGKVERADGHRVENIDDWLLHLGDFRWERLTQRQWQQWQLTRQDEKRLHLFEFQIAIWDQGIGRDETLEKMMTELEQQLGTRPDLTLAPLLYRPDLAHEALPDDESDFRIHRIKIDDIIVRYIGDNYAIQMTVEGELPAEVIDALRADLSRKLSALENSECEWTRL